jgi:hypothetical protein
MYLQKEISKLLEKKKKIMLASYEPLTKRAGSGSGSVTKCTNSRIWITLKMSLIRNTSTEDVKDVDDEQQCCGSGKFIPDPGFKRFPDPDPHSHQRI